MVVRKSKQRRSHSRTKRVSKRKSKRASKRKSKRASKRKSRKRVSKKRSNKKIKRRTKRRSNKKQKGGGHTWSYVKIDDDRYRPTNPLLFIPSGTDLVKNTVHIVKNMNLLWKKNFKGEDVVSFAEFFAKRAPPRRWPDALEAYKTKMIFARAMAARPRLVEEGHVIFADPDPDPDPVAPPDDVEQMSVAWLVVAHDDGKLYLHAFTAVNEHDHYLHPINGKLIEINFD